ncbi:hypothetical protein K9M74_04875 [Candidatus Woesearchaeota archaeon]|nr:hypothetical protein [Candidatus Woesearchaeota archaeon]
MNSLIKKLLKEKQIKLTEPSDIMCKAHVEKSRSSLLSAKTRPFSCVMFMQKLLMR